MIVAEWIVRLLALYVGIGVLFAPLFVFKGVNVVDPAAPGSTVGFRLIIVPGVVALWPLLLSRWLRGGPAPAESNAHRDTAQENGR